MTEESNINNKNHRTQEPTHVEETCTDRKGIKKRRKKFIKKRKQDYNIPCFKLRVQVRRANEKAKNKKTIAAKCAKRRSRRRGKQRRPRVAESRGEQRETRACALQRLQREHKNILITRVKEPNNLLSITISDSLINYAH